jgi:hypothetical protein
MRIQGTDLQLKEQTGQGNFQFPRNPYKSYKSWFCTFLYFVPI